MSEGNHSAVVTSTKTRGSRLPMIFGAIAVAALVGGVLFQFLRGEPTVAQVDASNDESGDNAGTAHISKRPGDLAILAKVNNQNITRDMVAVECLNRYGVEVLESIIDRLIVQQACEEQGVQVTDDEINNEVIKIAKRFNLTSDNWYQMLQAERKITPEQYRRNIIWPMLSLRKLAKDNIEVAEDDLRKAYIRDYGEKCKARMIMLDNKRRADEVWKQVDANPDQFGAIARKYSIEPNSRSLDGSIQPIRRYGGPDEVALEEAAFKLKEGEISGIIQVGPGQQYVILKCEGYTKRMVEFDEVKESLHSQILEEKVQISVANVFKKLKEDAKIHNFVTNETTGAGVKKVSATGSDSERVTPAAATTTRQRPAGQTQPQQQPQQRPRQAPRTQNAEGN